MIHSYRGTHQSSSNIIIEQNGPHTPCLGLLVQSFQRSHVLTFKLLKLFTFTPQLFLSASSTSHIICENGSSTGSSLWGGKSDLSNANGRLKLGNPATEPGTDVVSRWAFIEEVLRTTMGSTPIPCDTTCGMPKERHVSSFQLRKKSELRKLGGNYFPPSRRASNGCFIFLVAAMKGTRSSMEGTLAVFSQPRGRSGKLGNGTTEVEIDEQSETLEHIDGAFCGVVMTVTFSPRLDKALDMSSNGMVWP